MAKKDGSGGKMNTGIGLCSYKDNPLPAPRQTSSEAGPGSNPDQAKVNNLLKKAYSEKESLRGKGV